MDEEERELIESIEETPVDQLRNTRPEVKKEIEKAAKEVRRARETKMNIRIDREELQRIKQQASREGLKYQSFVKSIIHKYITGQLVEDKNRKRAG
jgi:predicted DNA binding CopG/RHH family protein